MLHGAPVHLDTRLSRSQGSRRRSTANASRMMSATRCGGRSSMPAVRQSCMAPCETPGLGSDTRGRGCGLTSMHRAAAQSICRMTLLRSCLEVNAPGLASCSCRCSWHDVGIYAHTYSHPGKSQQLVSSLTPPILMATTHTCCSPSSDHAGVAAAARCRPARSQVRP